MLRTVVVIMIIIIIIRYRQCLSYKQIFRAHQQKTGGVR